MKCLEDLIPLLPFESLSQEREEVIQLQGGRGKNKAADNKTRVEFLLKIRLQMLEVSKLASFTTTGSEQLREQCDD